MPRYRVTEPQSGKSLILTRDNPPDEATIKQAFGQGQTQSQPYSALGELLGGRFGNILPALGNEVSRLGQQAQENPQDFALGFAGSGLAQPRGFGGANVLNPVATVKDLLGYLTKKGVGQKIGQKVEQATIQGKADTLSDVATEFRQAVGQKLGNLQPYTNIANSRVTSMVPSSIAEEPLLTPRDLLNLRQQAAAREPQGIFKVFQGKSPANQVDEVLRQVTSSRLKDITPGLAPLDKLFSIYSKIGSPAEIAVRGGGAALLGQLFPREHREKATEVLEGMAALLKILGI